MSYSVHYTQSGKNTDLPNQGKNKPYKIFYKQGTNSSNAKIERILQYLFNVQQCFRDFSLVKSLVKVPLLLLLMEQKVASDFYEI